MNQKIFAYLSLICLFMITCPLMMFSQDLNRIDLGGSWKFRKAGTTKWMDATVPGEVHLDLMKNKVITNPFFRDNEQYQKWIGEIGWEYQKVFFIEDTLLVHRNIELVCKGLDTYANVYLNDSLVIVADNMFRTWYSDIRMLLRNGMNTIRVQFPAVMAESKTRYEKLNFTLPGGERVVCRKAAFQFGSEFSPSFMTYGIWKPIYIRYWDFVNVLGIHYEQKRLTDTLAKVDAEITLVSTLADTAQIRLFMNDSLIAMKDTLLKKGANVIVVPLEIRNPKRWWPNGLGEPNLYTIRHEVSFGGKIRGEGQTRIGLRTIELVQKRDSAGHSFLFRVNGIPIFMKGANYVPQDLFLTRVSDSSYREIVRKAAASNMNMLRVWGGGVYEKDCFYDYCDEYGILVWHDFMFANAVFPDDKRFQQNVQAEVIQNVVRLRNHPCIAVWCGNNEIDDFWKNGKWQERYVYSSEDSIKINNLNFKLFNELLRAVVRKYSPGTPYTPTSPKTAWEKPESQKAGDRHYWGVWDAREPIEAYNSNSGRFVSEYGFQSFPDLSTIQKFTETEDVRAGSPVMQAHQKYPDGNFVLDEYVLRYYKKPKKIPSYIYTTQLLQAEAAKTAIMAHRRAMPVCMGSLYWQLNDSWPGITWSAYDYYGNRKILGHRLEEFFATTIVSPVIEDKNLKIYIVSDNLEKREGNLLIELYDFTGKLHLTKSLKVTIPSNSSAIVMDTSLAAITNNLDKRQIIMYLALTEDAKTIARNSLFFDLPKNLDLKVPNIEKKVSETPEGYIVELTSDQFAKDVYVKMPFKGQLSENYFDLMPGKAKTLVYQTGTHFGDISNMIRIISVGDAGE